MNVLRSGRITRLYLRLSPDSVRRALLMMTGFCGAALAATFIAHSAPWLPSPIRWQISLAAENSAATWFASMLLFAVVLVSLICLQVEWQIARKRVSKLQMPGPRIGSGVTPWAFLAVLFAGLSLDELGSIHERLNGLPGLTRFLPNAEFLAGWVGFLAVPIMGLAATILWFAWRNLRRVPGVSLLMTTGVALLLSVTLQDHLEITSGLANRHANSWGRPAWQILLEEGTELLGTLLFIAAALRHAEFRSRSLRRLDDKVALEIDWRFAAAMVVGFGLTFAVLHLLAPGLVEAPDGRGVPQNWFPATAALLCALFASHLAAADRSRIGAPPGSNLSLRLLVLVNLALSLGFGANYPVHRLLENRQLVQSAWIFLVGSGVLLTGMVTARITGSRVAGAGFLMWTAVYLIRPFLDLRSWSAISLIGQIALMVGLQGLLLERARQTMLVGERRSDLGHAPHVASTQGAA